MLYQLYKQKRPSECRKHSPGLADLPILTLLGPQEYFTIPPAGLQGGKTMKQAKVQTGLRIPQGRYDELLQFAGRSGISVNAAALMLIDIGLEVISLGKQEAAHVGLHSLPHNDEQ